MIYPKVSIIILNWNGLKDTIECLESLKKITYPNYEVIVVDNGSKGNDADILEEKYKKYIKVVRNKENLGFAEGNNIAIRQVLKEKKSKYVLLLNNDTVVDPNFLIELIRITENDKTVGLVGPKIYYYDNPKEIWFAGGKINKLGKISFPGSNSLDEGKITTVKEVDLLTGCALFIKIEILEKTGLLDLSYFLYYEDADFCCKTKRANYKIIFTPKSFIWHKVNKSSPNNSFNYLYYTTRNCFLFLKKNNFSLFWGLIFIFLRAIKRIFISLLSLKTKQAKVVLKAIISGTKDFFIGKMGKKINT